MIEVLRKVGGYATLRRLNELVDFTTWATKTPEASVRRIVQNSKEIFRIQPGLWALEEMRDMVLHRFDLKPGNKSSEEEFSHGYYQGLLVEIGKYRHLTTYVPAQDQNRLFIDKKLGGITDTTELPDFTHEELKRRARTIDVIWFNQRSMPTDFYEVEHTTDIKNSLTKLHIFLDSPNIRPPFVHSCDKYRRTGGYADPPLHRTDTFRPPLVALHYSARQRIKTEITIISIILAAHAACNIKKEKTNVQIRLSSPYIERTSFARPW